MKLWQNSHIIIILTIIHIAVFRLPDSWSKLEMLVFEERGKPEYPEENVSGQRRKPATNSTNIWRRRRDLNPGHIGGRRVLSSLRYLCAPIIDYILFLASKCQNWDVVDKKMPRDNYDYGVKPMLPIVFFVWLLYRGTTKSTEQSTS